MNKVTLTDSKVDLKPRFKLSYEFLWLRRQNRLFRNFTLLMLTILEVEDKGESDYGI